MSEEKIPRPVEGANIKAFDISAQEAFIHSCIDGVLNIDDIADLTVLPPADVFASVERLVSLKLVEWVVPKASSAPPVSELLEDVDIDEDLQKRIEEAYRRADKLNNYELLGVEVEADRAEIRRAYFALSKAFHPDSYYGKELGSFKAKMEVIFRKVTDAYEVLGRASKREAYDRYLQQSIAVSTAEKQINRVEERARAMAKALTKAPIVERQAEAPPEPSAASDRSATATPPKSTQSSEVPGASLRERVQRKRELLERRLRGRSRPASPSSSSVRSIPSPTAKVGKRTALRDLTRSLKQTAVLTGGVDRAEHHLENARVAEAQGDLAKAVTALRLAIALDSGNQELKQHYQRVNSHLKVQLVDIHREQARYEESNSMWAAASISWAKVAEAAPEDPIAPRRAAKAIMAAGGDLRKARDFALRSLELAPDSLDAHLILARIYIEAGMDHSAAKELDEAAKLDPGHEMVKNLRKQLAG